METFSDRLRRALKNQIKADGNDTTDIVIGTGIRHATLDAFVTGRNKTIRLDRAEILYQYLTGANCLGEQLK